MPLTPNLIGRETSFKPYWNPCCASFQIGLWYPVAADLPVSNQHIKSWFSLITWEAPKRASLKYSGCVASIQPRIEQRAKCIRLYPNKAQRRIMAQYFGAARWYYNKYNELERAGELKGYNWKGEFKGVREGAPDYFDNIPYQIKKMACADFSKAKSNAVRKYKKTGEASEIHFRSRKSPKQSCYIPADAIKDRGYNRVGVYIRYLGEVKKKEKLPENICGSRLVLEHGRYFLVVSYKKEITSATASENQAAVALDPGIRTFLTGFSESEAFKIGEGSGNRITDICLFMDKAKTKRAYDRAYWNRKDKIKELHYKAANYLCGHYSEILLPSFETSQMVLKASRIIYRKAVRSMLNLSFYKFKTRLEQKCIETGTRLRIVDESYTTKTHSVTGEVIEIGSADKITSQNIILDRDINGARGIYIKNMCASAEIAARA